MSDFAGSLVGESTEQWRFALSSPVLEVSNLGRVRMVTTARIVCPYVVRVKRTRPRLQVSYTHQLKRHHRRVARLVCEAFHGDPPTAEHVAMFIDGDSFNCRADNVRWATRAEVVQATVARGRHISGQHVLAEQRRGRDSQASRGGLRLDASGEHAER